MRRHRLPSSRARVLAAMAAGAVTAAVAGAWFLWAAPPPAQVRPPFVAGSPIATGRADLASARAGLQVWLTTHPEDAAAAVRLAELSLREARVTGNAGLVVEASARLRELVDRGTRTYEVERMLAALLLSEHRFVEARQMATRLLAHEPNDTWLHGVLGDAALEEGDYEAAFAAFDRMAGICSSIGGRPPASGGRRAGSTGVARIATHSQCLRPPAAADVAVRSSRPMALASLDCSLRCALGMRKVLQL